MKNLYTVLCLLFLSLGLNPQKAQAQYYLEDRWPNLRFNFPVAMYPAPDNTKRIFVIEQNGRIKVFKDSGTVAATDTQTFINIRSRLPNIGVGSETGLLGMAFHPQFASNGYVFLNYTRSPNLTTVVSRFTVDPANPNRLNPNSEKIILTVPQPFSNHNAGEMIFGADGYLYITMGDGGSGGDPGNRAQNRSEFLGKILRIDVNVPEGNPAPYLIPADNPFAGNSNGWKEEIGTWGMRNPWKISKDPAGSTIWIADVGQNQIEEVDTFRLGANYGWKVMEGNNAYSACGSCDTSNYERPIFTYNRSMGNSITGGYVYRGTELFDLVGSYIYGDYGSRNMWYLKKNAAGQYVNNNLISAGGSLSSFGLDHENEIYVVRYTSNTGRLMKLRCGPATPSITTTGPLSVCEGDSVVLLAPTAGLAGFRWSNGDTSRRLVLKQPGQYDIQLQTRNAFGCWSYKSAAVQATVRPKPEVNLAIPAGFCEGESASISLPTENSWTWNQGPVSGNLVISQPGSFWIRATDAQGCQSDTFAFGLQPYPAPATPAIASTGANLISTSLVAGATYEWFRNGTLLSAGADTSLEVSLPGAYQVRVISAQGCKSDTSVAFLVTRISKTRHAKNQLELSPNPVRDLVRIGLPSRFGAGRYALDILNMEGASVYQTEVEVGTQELETRLPDLPAGSYFLQLRGKEGMATGRFKKVQ